MSFMELKQFPVDPNGLSNLNVSAQAFESRGFGELHDAMPLALLSAT